MSKFFNPSFWFNQQPEMLIPFWKNSLIAVIIIFLVLAGFVFIAKKSKNLYSKLLEKLFNFFTINFFIGLLLLFFNQEMIPLFSARFWHVIWFTANTAWIFFIIRYAKTLPERKKEIEKEKEFQKYLPK